jgi:hypothetical protein
MHDRAANGVGQSREKAFESFDDVKQRRAVHEIFDFRFLILDFTG